MDAKEFVGHAHEVNGGRWEVTEEMAEAVQLYLDLVRSQPGERMVEVAVPTGFMTGEIGATGTADSLVIDVENRILYVNDYKHGRGERVDAANNEQLLCYAAGAYEMLSPIFDIEELVLTIIQPRINNISSWEVPASYVEGFAEDVGVAAQAVAEAEKFFEETGDFNPDLFAPSDKACRWCKAKASCPALAAQVFDVVDEFQDISSLSAVDLATAMSKVEMVRQWCDAVEAKTLDRLRTGVKVSGWKLVRGREGQRRWANEEKATQTLREMFGDKGVVTKPLSPTEAEKVAKQYNADFQTFFGSLIERAEGKPTLVPESDKRPAMTLADDFDDLTKTQP
jgi:hypothetical protein